MVNVNNEAYELSYDDDHVILIDKRNNELIIRIFNDKIDSLNIDAKKTNICINSKNFKVNTEEYIDFQTNVPREFGSIFFNSTEEEKEFHIKKWKNSMKSDK